MSQFLGKYRGKVINNIDPLLLGRIIAIVPAISELPLSWALPSVPYAGLGVGFFALPPIGANVWIEFEAGDPNYPIWTGCFWGEGQIPAQPALPTTFVFKTNLATLSIDDLKAELTLQIMTPSGVQTVAMNSGGIKLSSNTVTASIAPEAIEFKNGPASIEVAPASIGLHNLAASIDVTPANIGLHNAAASIDLSPASVSLNNGALEVI